MLLLDGSPLEGVLLVEDALRTHEPKGHDDADDAVDGPGVVISEVMPGCCNEVEEQDDKTASDENELGGGGGGIVGGGTDDTCPLLLILRFGDGGGGSAPEQVNDANGSRAAGG